MNTCIKLCFLFIFSICFIYFFFCDSLINLSYSSTNNGMDKIPIKIKNITLLADIAKTPDQQSKGLSIKNSLYENESMLFPFTNPNKYSFWMKDMKFPIDIIWISANKTIVHIEKNLSPCLIFFICPSYTPNENSLYVLEVVSNFTTKYNILPGMKIDFDATRFIK